MQASAQAARACARWELRHVLCLVRITPLSFELLMLASVLSRFFALYTSANSFVRLAVHRNGEPWMTCPPMSGRQCLV